MDALNALPEVELAKPAPVPAPAPSAPDFETLQGYLSPAAGGLDAYYAWDFPGGAGTGISICDIEGGWNLDHEDLPPATVLIPDGESIATVPKDDHGTEVLGTMFSLRDSLGTTGASYEARCLVAPVYLDSGYALFQQILWAASHLDPGDVILLEVQTVGPYFRADGTQFGYVPVEWEPSIYNAILTAVGNGIHVIEPAGNGNQNLDDPIYVYGNFGHTPFLPEHDSGAIIIGAGIPPTAPELGPDRSRSSFSNFGSRLNLQGWGHRVTTTGGGDLYSAEGPNRAYTHLFGGTSSAAPLVASGVASIEGIVAHGSATPIPPGVMRALLIETGTPQQDGTRPAAMEPIGPRPDLRSAIQRMSTPIISAPQVVRAYEGDLVRFTALAMDLDGDPIGAFTAGPLPSGASFFPSGNNSTGDFMWSTTIGQAGAYDVVFTASNTAQTSDTVRVEIVSGERGPMVTGPGGVLGIEGGPPVQVTMHATDPNGDAILSFTASNLPPGATFSADSMNTSGVFSWRPDFDQAGQHVVEFTAISMSGGGQELAGQGLLVLTIFDNDRAPVVQAPNTVAAAEAESLSFAVTAEDPDGDAIANLRAEGLPAGASFQTNEPNESGVLAWRPAFDQAGFYFVNFFAENDGSGMAGTVLLISNTDRKPTVAAPTSASGVEGETLTFDATSADPDGDQILEFQCIGLPPGALFSPLATPSSAHFSWTPQSGQAGNYQLKLVAISQSTAGAVPSDSAAVDLTIETGQFTARAYLLPGMPPLRLGSGAATLCVQVEAVAGNFDLTEVVPESVGLSRVGDGSVERVNAQSVVLTTSDLDNNGILEFTACFTKEALRQLFGDLEGGRQSIEASVDGHLVGGGEFNGSLNVEVIPERSLQDVAVVPNPTRGVPVLSFYTGKAGAVRLRVFDVRGRLLGTPVSEPHLGPGFHDFALRVKRQATGIAYYKLETPDGIAAGKFIILK